MVQTPHGSKRVQVKTAGTGEDAIRVRGLGATTALDPADRYDVLAVVHTHHLWLIPSVVLGGADTITLKPDNTDCRYSQFLER